MGTMLARRLAIAAVVLLAFGTTSCAANSAPSPHTGASEKPTEPSAPGPETISLAAAQADIPWPEAMTLPKPTNMTFDGVENEYACDGTILAVLVRSPDATEQSARSYLEGIQDLFHIPEDVRAGHGAGSLSGHDSSGLSAEGRLQDQPSAADMTKIVNWEKLDGAGYRFHFQETGTPGTSISTRTTPPSTWAGFLFPDVPWEDCVARESSGYREGTGFTPASTTWTLKGSPVMQPQVQEWMEGLASDGWSVTENPAMAGAGMPEAVLTSDEYKLHYAMSDGYLTLFISDRKLDKFLGL